MISFFVMVHSSSAVCTEDACTTWSNLEADCGSYDDVNKTAACHASCVPKCMAADTCDGGVHANVYPLEWADTGCLWYAPTTAPSRCTGGCPAGSRCMCSGDDVCVCISPGDMSVSAAEGCSERQCQAWSDLELDCGSYDDVNKTAACHAACVPKCIAAEICDGGANANFYPLEWADTGCLSYPPRTAPTSCAGGCPEGTRCMCPGDAACTCIAPGDVSGVRK